MSSIANTIQADVKTLTEMLDSKKYQVDYFQREYKWGRKHIEQLLVDLEAAFLSNYESGHTLENIASYNCYYLGPVVLSEKGTVRSIVDGQQRLTSMTLLLIYLNNQQKENAEIEEIDSLIYSRKHGRKSYNIEVPDRTPILESLYQNQEYDITEEDDESVKTMYDRYNDIVNLFSPELKNNILPLFIDWLKEKIVFVEIVAYSDENAYTIFETMNDRGLNLTPTEMLKGYILTNVKDLEKINELNVLWKNQISILHSFSPQEDLEFCKAWMRGVYAESIRQTTKGAENEDFEKIGTRFHTWIKDNHRHVGLKDSETFYYFVKSDFQFYSNIYIKLLKAINVFNPNYQTLFISSFWNIASSLSYPLLLASINKTDDEQLIDAKINTVSKFIDIFVVTRMLKGKPITQTAIRYFIYTLVKEIRNSELFQLKEILRGKLINSNENLNDLYEIIFYPSEKKFIHYLFARMTYHIESKIGLVNIHFEDLMAGRKRNRYVLTPMVRPFYDDYRDSFVDEGEFFNAYNSIGNYVLIPNQLAQPFSLISSVNKLDMLKNEYFLSASCSMNSNLDFYPESIVGNYSSIPHFDLDSINQRSEYLIGIIKEIWSIDSL